MRIPFIKKLRRIKSFLAGVVLSGCVFFFIQAKTASDNYFEVAKNLDIFSTLLKELNTYYVDPIEPGQLVKTGIDAMLDNLDPYTNYITESDIEEYEFQTTGKYGGIGASMRKKGEDIYVGDVYENSPAQKAGLHPGDLIISIDNQRIKGKTIDDISVLLKGSPGTQVSIKIKDVFSGAVSDKIITRGEIELSSVPYAGLTGKDNDIAYVRLTQFTDGCARQVKFALDSLKGVQPKLKGVVLDLRNNPGGLLNEAVDMCNLFLDKGQLVVSTKGKLAELDKDYKTPGPAWNTDIPLAVIVNHSSASASEIVSGTMQDDDRGVIIGERSYGKGLVQNVRPLGYNAKLKLTTAKYYTPSGRCIQAIDYSHRGSDGRVGFVPDSLKKEFKTRNGRIVKSGGGIDPDVLIKDAPMSRLAIMLYTKNYFFDYATLYVQNHKTIAPADAFSLTDEEFNQFAKWLEGKDYSYQTETEDAFDSLKQTAIREKYFDAAKSEFTALQNKISHDKKQELYKNKDEIRHILENEIVSRYYYLRGRIAQSLISDKEFNRALEILENQSEYNSFLQGKK
jgi:carboxyl-terminal processing protease